MMDDDVAPLLRRLLSDEDCYVRSYAVMGLERAIKGGQLSRLLRDKAYPVLLEQCNIVWPLSGNDSAGVLIQLDRVRAASDLSDPTILSTNNPNLRSILQACNRASMPLPAAPLQAIFEEALPRIVGKNPYPPS
ncbi:MAG: hypothetical protein HC909_03855, partial [Blastochloris sp.]|nr:hypothetical protein [Blastochloris sp.]